MAISVEEFVKRWNSNTNSKLEELTATPQGLQNMIQSSELNRPGLSLAGYFEHFSSDCIQVFGNSESGYLQKLVEAQNLEIMTRFFDYPIQAVFFTNNNKIPPRFIQWCREHHVPLYRSSLETRLFIQQAIRILEDECAPQVTIHGVLVDVYGVGILLRGKSGVGKSETALELIERGHRFIADDLVTVIQTSHHTLEGRASELAPYYMEIRGLGIIDIKNLFGIRAVRERMRVELVIQLVHWEEKKEIDRLGIHDYTFPILDISLPFVELPVRPGRNIPIIVETAAIHARAKKLGINSAKELDRRMMNYIHNGTSDA
jgi:HPr kinase/phosphorylase